MCERLVVVATVTHRGLLLHLLSRRSFRIADVLATSPTRVALFACQAVSSECK